MVWMSFSSSTGERPASVVRSGELSVRAMMSEARDFPVGAQGATGQFRVGTTSGLGPLPAWRQDADFLFVQVGSHQGSGYAFLGTLAAVQIASAPGQP
jgi:hypothetical protein